MKTVIIDYGMGNLRSVQKAVEFIGESAEISSEIAVISAADRLILPGVGAFRDAISALNKSGISEIIKKKVSDGAPILGICLGMQLMYEKSLEDGEYDGLGLVKGTIKKFIGDYKIPHIGWNTLTPVQGVLTRGLEDNPAVYFVHSYYAEPSGITDALCNYAGVDFTASIHDSNVFATQFHPEKSGDTGLIILKNFFLFTEK